MRSISDESYRQNRQCGHNAPNTAAATPPSDASVLPSGPLIESLVRRFKLYLHESSLAKLMKRLKKKAGETEIRCIDDGIRQFLFFS